MATGSVVAAAEAKPRGAEAGCGVCSGAQAGRQTQNGEEEPLGSPVPDTLPLGEAPCPQARTGRQACPCFLKEKQVRAHVHPESRQLSWDLTRVGEKALRRETKPFLKALIGLPL